MKKIPTLFVRDHTQKHAPIMAVWHPDCIWVRDGEGHATRKWDGTSCMWDGAKLWKRREIKGSDCMPPGFSPEGQDPETGKIVGWVPVGDGPDDQWHREALADKSRGELVPGTYELVGPKVNGNKDKCESHHFERHGNVIITEAPRSFFELRDFLANSAPMEGLVWHHPDGRMAKIKRRDYGLTW